MNSNKNKLNSEIIFIFYWYLNRSMIYFIILDYGIIKKN